MNRASCGRTVALRQGQHVQQASFAPVRNVLCVYYNPHIMCIRNSGITYVSVRAATHYAGDAGVDVPGAGAVSYLCSTKRHATNPCATHVYVWRVFRGDYTLDKYVVQTPPRFHVPTRANSTCATTWNMLVLDFGRVALRICADGFRKQSTVVRA